METIKIEKKPREVKNSDVEIGVVCKSNSSGEFVIIELIPFVSGQKRMAKVKFLNTGNELIKKVDDIKRGEVYDELGEINKLVGQIYTSKNDGKFKVLKFEGKSSHGYQYLVEFLNTHNKYVVFKSNLTRGAIADKFLYQYKIGQLFDINDGEDILEIIEGPIYKELDSKKSNQYYKVKSTKYPDFVKIVDKYSLEIGAVLNPLIPNKIDGKFIGIGEYNSVNQKRIYDTWNGIFWRVFHKKNDKNYNNLVVDKDFFNFQIFCDFYLKQRELYKEEYWNDLQFDKDYLYFINRDKDNKGYLKGNCLLLPSDINGFLTGIYEEPILKQGEKYQVWIGNTNMYFDSFEEATVFYFNQKESIYNNLLKKYQLILPFYHYNILKDFNFRDSFNWYHGTNY